MTFVQLNRASTRPHTKTLFTLAKLPSEPVSHSPELSRPVLTAETKVRATAYLPGGSPKIPHYLNYELRIPNSEFIWLPEAAR